MTAENDFSPKTEVVLYEQSVSAQTLHTSTDLDIAESTGKTINQLCNENVTSALVHCAFS